MTTKSEFRQLRYPYEGIFKTTDYLEIQSLDYVSIGGQTEVGFSTSTESIRGLDSRGRGTLNRKKKVESITDTVYLPIPSNIQDGNSVNFGSSNLDGLTASVLDYVVKTTGESSTQFDSLDKIGTFITKTLQSGLSLFADNPAALDYFNRTIAASAANIPFGGNLTASQLLARQTGQVLNPNMELLFEGVNLRSFKFSFKMTPRDEREAEEVKNIIRFFKRNMVPEASTFYLKTPRVFNLAYKQGPNLHPFLHKFKQCALTDMSVNYTGEGTYATYGPGENSPGGTPVSMVMDLGFKELEPIYSGDYEENVGGRDKRVRNSANQPVSYRGVGY
jgi:hypothetical protein